MPDYARLDRFARENGLALGENEPMHRHTTFRIGGPADRFLTVTDQAQLRGLLRLLAEEEIPWLVLGRGSDLLVSDRGIRGAVIALEGSFREIALLEDGLSLRAGAGASLAALCAFARDNRLSGLEFAWGIPGSVGGAMVMNAGAYGGEMKDVVTAVTHMDKAGRVETAAGDALDFAYRHSRYSDGTELVLEADFRLSRGEPAAIAGKMDELMARRRDKQPYDLPSGGSVFKRPEGHFAGALIEGCGLKGKQIGGAQVSPKHAGFIVNNGGASCADVRALIALIQETVLRETGVALEPELRLVGEE